MVALPGDAVPSDEAKESYRKADAFVSMEILPDLVSTLVDAISVGGHIRNNLDCHSTVKEAAQTRDLVGMGTEDSRITCLSLPKLQLIQSGDTISIALLPQASENAPAECSGHND